MIKESVVMRCFGAIISAVLILAACQKASEPSVWDLYDVRYPVPAGSNVPVSRAMIYDRYTDNDSFYVPPQGQLCQPGSLGGGCE